MKVSSLENKTIRPGLLAYNFYSSDRHPLNPSQSQPKAAKKAQAKLSHLSRSLTKLLVLALVGLVLYGGFRSIVAQQSNNIAPHSSGARANAVTAANACLSNSQDQLIVIGIGQRHLWACHNYKVMYDTPVVTGMANYVADKTPTGTFHIYAKQTNTTLTGADSTGQWSDPVSYWMPFLDNQYGSYGFHDATWRPASAFGNIDPSSNQASHGCVELPLAASKWLYDWSQVGTAVTIEN